MPTSVPKTLSSICKYLTVFLTNVKPTNQSTFTLVQYDKYAGVEYNNNENLKDANVESEKKEKM